jgi:tight adherence protein B
MLRDSAQTVITLVLSVSVFGLVLALWLAIILVWVRKREARAKQMRERLGTAILEGGEGRVINLWHSGGVATATVPLLGGRSSLWARVHDQFQRAGWEARPEIVLALVFGSAFVLAVFTHLLTENLVFALGIGVATVVIFRMYLRRRVGKHSELFEKQLVDALGLAARSLRAGHPLISAFHIVSEEMVPPISETFAGICQQHEMGAGIHDALRKIAADTPSTDMKLFATSVAIQSRSGGNLADLMDRLAVVIRDRLRVGRRVRVLTAQTQLSKRVLVVLPVIVFLILNVINPDYMLPLYTTAPGKFLLGFGVVALVAGAWMMDRICNLEY